MKLQHLILLLFFMICFSCEKQNASFNEKNATYQTIDSFYKLSFSEDISFKEQVKATDEGILFSKKNEIDSLYLKGISYKAYLYMDTFPDSSNYYINKLISTSLQKNNKKYAAYSFSLKGNSFYNQLRYDSAYYYFKKANVVYYDVNDSVSLGYNQLMMARIHYFYNDYNASEELITQAIEYLQKRDTIYLTEAYNILGSIYKKSDKYDEAITYYQKALTLAEKKSLEESYLRNNIASLYIASHQYEKAKHVLYNLLDSELVKDDKNLQSAVLLNLGSALFRQNNNDGFEQILKSLQIRERLHFELLSIENYIEISDFYALKNKSTAINYLEKALTLATKHKSVDNEILSLKKLIPLTNGDVALNYSQEYIRLNDSITTVRNHAKNQFAKMRFDYSKELEQNQMLKSKEISSQLVIQKQKNTHLILCAIISLVVLSSVFYYFIVRNKHKKEKLEENYKAEQRIATRIHDELANDVYHTISYAENTDLSEEQNKVKLLDHLEDVYNRTRNISKENSLIPTGNEYVSYLKNMLFEFQNHQVKIITSGMEEFPWNSLNDIKKVVLYRIIQELLVNMKKHSQANLVVVKFSKINKNVEIKYTDNGIGFIENKEKMKNGLQNVETRIKTINGSITFESKINKGVEAVLRFPI